MLHLGLKLWCGLVVVAEVGGVRGVDAEKRMQVVVELQGGDSNRSRLRAVVILQPTTWLTSRQARDAGEWWVHWTCWVAAAVGVAARREITRAGCDLGVLGEHILSFLGQAHGLCQPNY